MPARLQTMRPAPAQSQAAVIYARVSSTEQEREGFSIPAQLRLLHEYAQQHGLVIQQEFIDVETAKRAGRTNFGSMITFLRKSNCRIILVEKTDRLLRNLKDYVLLDELSVELHFVKESVVLGPDSRSSEKFMHGIKVLMAKNYIDNLSEETRKGMLEKARAGLWPSYAPIGYVNALREDGKRIITPDPASAPAITQLFSLFATGEYSLKDLAAKARRDGLRLGNGKLHKSEVHQILRKRLYNGDFDWDGTTYQGSHAPLVTKEVWTRVQELLDAKQQPRRHKHEFAYTGLLTCGHCGCQLVAEIKKQQYVYYHCTGGKGTKCPEPYTREETLTQELNSILQELVVPAAITTWLRAALQESEALEDQARQDALKRTIAEYERINTRIEGMYLDKLDGRVTTEFYDEKASTWRKEQAELQERINRLNDHHASYQDAITQIEGTSTLCRQFPDHPPGDRRQTLKLLIKEARWQNGGLETTLNEPFQKLRVSNQASHTKQTRNGNPATEIGNWLGKMATFERILLGRTSIRTAIRRHRASRSREKHRGNATSTTTEPWWLRTGTKRIFYAGFRRFEIQAPNDPVPLAPPLFAHFKVPAKTP